MSAFDRSERLQLELPDILTEIAAPRVPDYQDEILALTAVTRQRPRWTFIERWLPMGVIARRPLFFPTLPWRAIIAAAVLIALVAAGAFFVGSQRHVPRPFGLARNGALVYDSDGDVVGRGSLTGESRTLVGGPTEDFAAGYTRDGTHLAFLRRTAGTPQSANERIQVFIADADGANPRALSGDLVAPDWFDWSPDDQKLVVSAGSQFGEHLFVIDVKQGGGQRQLDVGKPMTTTFPNFLGPGGTEIVFRGLVSTGSGIYAIHPDGSRLRAVTPTDGHLDNGYNFPQPSPDGRYVAYTTWDEASKLFRIHLIDLTTGNDRAIDVLTGRSRGYATFSPDGSRIIFTEFVGDPTDVAPDHRQLLVEQVDGSSAAIPMGQSHPIDDDVAGLFSPDGRSVIINNSKTKESRLIDAATGGAGEILPWSAGGITGWQRLAP